MLVLKMRCDNAREEIFQMLNSTPWLIDVISMSETKSKIEFSKWESLCVLIIMGDTHNFRKVLTLGSA
jgi:hypothetical protein